MEEENLVPGAENRAQLDTRVVETVSVWPQQFFLGLQRSEQRRTEPGRTQVTSHTDPKEINQESCPFIEYIYFVSSARDGTRN